MNWYVLGIIIPILYRGFFTFAFLMRWGQMLFERRKNAWSPGWALLAKVWVGAMFVSAVIDIIVNVTLLSLVYGDHAKSWNETYSYRLGRYRYEDTGWRHKVSKPIWKLLAFLEGEDHVAYIYGKIPCPYPDVKVLF